MSDRSDDDSASEDETLQALSKKKVGSAEVESSEEEGDDGNEDGEDDGENEDYPESEPGSGSSSVETFEDKRTTSTSSPATAAGEMHHSKVAFARQGKRKRNEKRSTFYPPPPPVAGYHKHTYGPPAMNIAVAASSTLPPSSTPTLQYPPPSGGPSLPLVFPPTAFEDNIRIKLTGTPDYYHVPENFMTPPLDAYGRIQVQSGDVLCGRGGATKKHPGNIRFRELISHLRNEYLQASKNHKTIISKLLVMAIRQTKIPSRFLKKNDRDEWMDIGDKRAWEKVSQAFREQKPREGEMNDYICNNQ